MAGRCFDMYLKLFMFISFFCLSALFGHKSAQALSCVNFTPDMMVDTVKRNAQSIVVKGDLQFDGQFKSTRDQSLSGSVADEPYDIITGTIKGRFVHNGELFEHDIQMRQYCVSVWCGNIQPVSDAVFLLHQDNNEYVLSLHACGGSVFRGVDERYLNDLRTCFNDGSCGSKDFKEKDVSE